MKLKILYMLSLRATSQVYFQRVLSSRTAEGAELLLYMASFGCLFMAIPPVILGAVAKAASELTSQHSGTASSFVSGDGGDSRYTD